MNLNITKFFTADVDYSDISGSRMEHGDDASRITWNNAKAAAPEFNFLDTDDKLDAMRAHLKKMGFSEADEEHDSEELNALLLQCIAGDIRDVCSDSWPGSRDWWEEYEKGSEAGRYAGRMYRAGMNPDGGDVYYYLGC